MSWAKDQADIGRRLGLGSAISSYQTMAMMMPQFEIGPSYVESLQKWFVDGYPATGNLIKVDKLDSVAAACVWRSSGFPIVQLAHKTAAALMCTKMASDLAPPSPWKAFVIRVPAGLVQITDQNNTASDVTTVLVHRHPCLQIWLGGTNENILQKSGPENPPWVPNGWSFSASTASGVEVHRYRKSDRMMTDEEWDYMNEPRPNVFGSTVPDWKITLTIHYKSQDRLAGD